MTDAIRPPRLARIWDLATGFAGFHAANAGLSIVYTLAQTLVFSRVLDHHTFSQTVAIQAVGLYLLPFNQSVARGNFVLLRERTVRDAVRGGLPEAAAAFQFNQILLLVLSLLIPPLVGTPSLKDYVSLTSFLFFCTYSNIWYFEMQMTLMATGHQMRFERITLIRRLINYGLLAFLFIVRDFLAFNILLAVQALAFHLFLLFDGDHALGLFGWPKGLRWAPMRAHFSRLWVSFQATLAEWMTLNGPYMVFTARFGIGPGLVAIDAIMKLLRMVVSVTRSLSEIALPRVTHAVFSGQPQRGRLPAALVLIGGGGAAAVVAIAVALRPGLSFDLLLGPNNTVPVAAGLPAALMLLSGVGFAAGANIVAHSGHARSIRRVMWFAAGGVGLFAVYVLAASASVVAALWAFVGVFVVVSAVALVMLARLLSGRGAPPEPPPA
jgi:hypothetical protein